MGVEKKQEENRLQAACEIFLGGEHRKWKCRDGKETRVAAAERGKMVQGTEVRKPDSGTMKSWGSQMHVCSFQGLEVA